MGATWGRENESTSNEPISVSLPLDPILHAWVCWRWGGGGTSLILSHTHPQHELKRTQTVAYLWAEPLLS